MLVNKSDHGLNRRSSSAWVKYADASHMIPFPCLSSRFSRFNAISFSATSLGTPTRLPLSTSSFFIHWCGACAAQPILTAIDTSTAERVGGSPECSSTIRNAHSRTSGETC